MPKTESSYAKRQRRKAEAIIQATGKYDAEIRNTFQDALDNEPSRLPHKFAVIEEADRENDRKWTAFKPGLHKFATEAYAAAIDYYMKHHDNPKKLTAALQALKSDV